MLNKIQKFSQYLVNQIQILSEKIENVQGKKLEFIACISYIIFHLLMIAVHEPWYDESVAWNIARSASLKDMLLTIPHYEGHPPLWHLILMPFAKLGAPYELSLSLVSLCFIGTACILIIWKSPFPRIIRLLLPFTYFFFFQYGVISRPYCMMTLAFVLLAMHYHKRNEKPLKYIILLMFLCLTSAYGIAIAGGLSIVWVLEIWNFENIITFAKRIVKDKRFWYLLFLLFFALMLIVMIIPYEDTFATNYMSSYMTNNRFLFCLVYMLFALPMEVSLSAIYVDDMLLKLTNIPISLLLSTCLLGVAFWFISICFGKVKKTRMVLIIPYALFSVFASIVYVSYHHIGIGLLFFVFWFWISCEVKTEERLLACFEETTKKIIYNSTVIVGSVAMITSLYWNISSCVQDVLYSYAPGREEAKFIKENGLDKYRIMVGWSMFYNKEGTDMDMNINHCNRADNIVPYFEHNLFFNFNDGRDDLNYSTHKIPSKKYTEECFEKWKEQLPDVCYEEPLLELVYDDLEDYTTVYEKEHNLVWKGVSRITKTSISVRTELAKELGLEPIIIE